MTKRTHMVMRSSMIWGLLGCLVIGTVGCNWFEYPMYVLFGGKKQKVKAEYAGLANTRVALVVATEPGTDFEYPYAATNLALATAHSIANNVEGVTFVDQEEIETFKQEDLDWYTLTLEEMGRKFSADRVLYMDVMRFTMAEENSIGLLRGRIEASLRVYDMRSATPNAAAYESEVGAAYPEHGPTAMSEAARQEVQRRTMLLFAEACGKRFYDHTVQE